MKKFGSILCCALLATMAVACDDEGEDTPSGDGGGGSGGSGGSGGDGGVCGDAIIDPGEECDDGNTVDGDACNADCTLPEGECGNGTVEAPEACDDGNTADGDACSADCMHTFIAISGNVTLNPVVARHYALNGIAAPAVEGLTVRAVDPIKSLAGDPNATLATATAGADGSYDLGMVETTDISLGMVLTVSDDGADPVIVTSTMGVCQPGASAPAPDCSADIADFGTYVMPTAYVAELQTALAADPVLISDTEGFVFGAVIDTNGTPIADASVTAPGADLTFIGADLTDTGTELTSGETGAFVFKPDGIKTLTVEKAGTDFITESATVGSSSGVAFQVLFLAPAAPPSCGNGTVDAGETCDDGNTTSGDGCDQTCQIEAVVTCGDGNVEGDEVCDDGNTADGDRCSADCMHTFVQVTGQVAVNPFAGAIHTAAGVAAPTPDTMAITVIEPVARLADPGNPAAGVVGQTMTDATGAFTLFVDVTNVPLGLVVTVSPTMPASGWVASTMGLCVAPCDQDIAGAPVFAVTELANGALEASFPGTVDDASGYILGMALDVTAGPGPMDDVGVTAQGADPASILFLQDGAVPATFEDNGTERTGAYGTFISTHAGIAAYTAEKTGVTFSQPTQQAAPSAGVVFQVFFTGAPTP